MTSQHIHRSLGGEHTNRMNTTPEQGSPVPVQNHTARDNNHPRGGGHWTSNGGEALRRTTERPNTSSQLGEATHTAHRAPRRADNGPSAPRTRPTPSPWEGGSHNTQTPAHNSPGEREEDEDRWDAQDEHQWNPTTIWEPLPNGWLDDSRPEGAPGEDHNPAYPLDRAQTDTVHDGETAQAHEDALNTAHRGKKRSRAALRLASINIKGGGSPATEHKWRYVSGIITAESLSAIAVQETHLTQEKLEDIQNRFERLTIFNSPDPEHPSRRGGVGFILNNHKTKWKETSMEVIVPGRAITVTMTWGESAKMKIAAVYAPSGDDAENASFWDTLRAYWTRHPTKKPDLLMGDLNMVENGLDRLPARADATRVTDAMLELRTLTGLQDGWRLADPTAIDYTFSTNLHNHRNSRSRIDRIYAKDNLLSNCDEWTITETGLETDHRMVSVYITSNETPFVGTGRATIPFFLTDFKEFRDRIFERGERAQTEIQETRGPRVQEVWKAFKRDLLEIAKEFTKNRTSEIDSQIHKWEARRKEALNRIAVDPEDEDSIALDEADENIRSLREAKVLQRRVNMTARHHAMGETGVKYDYILHREREPRDTIPALRIPGTDPPVYEKRSREMVKIATQHHDKLQDAYPDDTPTEGDWKAQSEMVLRTLKPRLDEGERNALNESITEDEVNQAITEIKNGKAAGLDGIPIEIWKYLQKGHSEDTQQNESGEKSRRTISLANMMAKVLNSIIDDGVAPGTDFAEGWMCPIHKKKAKTDIGNYRPITILNNDYKVLTKVLTERTSTVAHKLIHPDQAGFIKGRSIFDQTELIHTVVHACGIQGTEGAIICLDQEKAYDKIRHDFLWATLDTLGFPEKYTRAIQHLYKSAETRVILNGLLGNKFKIRRGVRQGDPLSCLLFDLAIESLAEMIRSSKLQGIHMNGTTSRVLSNLFADDTTVFLSNYDDVDHLFHVLKEWCKASGAKFNIEKTVAIILGDEQYRQEVRRTRRLTATAQNTIPPEVHIAEEGEPVRILGAFYGHGFSEDDIWAPILTKATKTLSRWAKHRPTIRGLTLGNNTMIGGYTQYITRVQGMPKHILKKLNQITDDIIYAKNGERKTNAIGIETLRWEKDAGGMKVLDLNSRNEAISAITLSKYASPNDRPVWAQAADRCLAKAAVLKYKNVGEEFLTNPLLQSWKVNLKSKHLTTNMRNMMSVAYKYGTKVIGMNLTNETRLNMPYWYHIGSKSTLVSKYNDKYGKCQRTSHGVQLVRDMVRHANKRLNVSCSDTDACECAMCTEDQIMGCDSPPKCRRNASKKLDNLSEKWDPRCHTAPAEEAQPHPLPELGRDYVRADLMGRETTDNPLQLVRIFTGTDNEREGEAEGTAQVRDRDQRARERHRAPENPEQQHIAPRGDVEVYTDGSCHGNGTGQAKCGSGIWYGDEDERNQALRVNLPENSNNVGELVAVLKAVQTHRADKRLRIVSDSKYVIDILTERAEEWLDKGFVGIANKEVVMALIAEVMNADARIFMKKVKGHSGNKGNDGADKLADEGSRKEPPDAIDLSKAEELKALGAKLESITQAEAYKSIRERRGAQTRVSTEVTMQAVRGAVEGQTGTDLVMITGNPWVFSHVPVPVPAMYPYP